MTFLGAIARSIQENVNFGETNEEAQKSSVYGVVTTLTKNKSFIEKLSLTEILKVVYGIMYLKEGENYRNQSEGMYICEQKYRAGFVIKDGCYDWSL